MCIAAHEFTGALIYMLTPMAIEASHAHGQRGVYAAGEYFNYPSSSYLLAPSSADCKNTQLLFLNAPRIPPPKVKAGFLFIPHFPSYGECKLASILSLTYIKEGNEVRVDKV